MLEANLKKSWLKNNHKKTQLGDILVDKLKVVRQQQLVLDS